mmetsp:Transcript_140137/g.247673  ORF Transcript_140137/g.247673 Transcript_140137/m.247673 type:complete len:153 (+) Transcript_140137:3-461(+)
MDFVKLGLIEVDFGSVRAKVASKKFWRFVGLTVLDFCCKLYGMTKIASVFFADMCLGAILTIDEEDVDTDDQVHGDKEKYLFEGLHTALDPGARRKESAEGEGADNSRDAGQQRSLIHTAQNFFYACSGQDGCCGMLSSSRRRGQPELLDTE